MKIRLLKKRSPRKITSFEMEGILRDNQNGLETFALSFNITTGNIVGQILKFLVTQNENIDL